MAKKCGCEGKCECALCDCGSVEVGGLDAVLVNNHPGCREEDDED